MVGVGVGLFRIEGIKGGGDGVGEGDQVWVYVVVGSPPPPPEPSLKNQVPYRTPTDSAAKNVKRPIERSNPP